MNARKQSNHEIDCDEALGWISLFRSTRASDEDRQNFALWLAGRPSRKHAMDKMLEFWEDLGAVSALPFQPTLNQPAANSSRWQLGGAIAMVAACLLVAVTLWPFSSAPSASQILQTSLGEQKVFELEDKSRITLNTASQVRVSYTEDQRYIVLIRGEAYFEVTPNESRPFHVDAGTARATVLGTAFNIYRSDNGAEITVTEGVVRVTELGSTGARSAQTDVLRANQQLTASQQGLAASHSVDTQAYIAWRQGDLVADEMQLTELVRQLERYHDTRILISDPEVAALKISGVFRLDQPDALILALEKTLDLKSIQVDNNTLQLLKARN
jgi:transmembrane sensor